VHEGGLAVIDVAGGSQRQRHLASSEL
jgi:hypothetical protein